jgi:hypothetical protein
MYYNVNLFAIIIASLGALMLGWAWYSPRLFGGIYRKLLSQGSTQMPEMTKKYMVRGLIVMFLSGLLQSAVLYFLIVLTRAGTLAQFMTIVFLVWAGFQLAGITTDTIWKNNSPALIVIDGLFALISNILIVVILLLIL